MTVVVVWPPGLLDAAVYEQKTSMVEDHPGVIAAALVLLGALFYYIVAWVLVGKDPEKGTIIPQYDPPPGFSPAAVRFVNRMGFDNTCFSAAVVGLAVKGAVTIDEFGGSYTLKRRGEGKDLHPEEIQLYNKLLGSSKSIELDKINHSRIGGARKALRRMLSTLLEKTHFVRNLKWWFPGLALSLLGTLILVFTTGSSPAALFLLLWLSLWTVGTTALLSQVVGMWRSGSLLAAIPLTLFSLPFAAGWAFGAGAFFLTAGPWAAAALLFSAVMNVIFYHLIKAPTRHGRRIMDHIEGFKHYLSVAEEERLNLLNPPEQTPELFERFLPYALALDCEQQWSEKFDAILQAAGTTPGEGGGYRPSFYTGSYTGMDRAMGVAAIGGALTGALASSSSAPSSSGSGGGGSSGGGGGGGGGGGW
jgi:uncharacterized membrane protein YgcG